MEVKQIIHAHISAHDPDGDLLLMPHDMSEYGHIHLGEVEVTYEIEMPSKVEIRDKKVDAINDEITKVKADAEITVERLMGDIQRLMAIEP